jgi:hypothetical protein
VPASADRVPLWIPTVLDPFRSTSKLMDSDPPGSGYRSMEYVRGENHSQGEIGGVGEERAIESMVIEVG